MEGEDIYQSPHTISAKIEDMDNAELRRYHSKDEMCLLAVGWFYLYIGSLLVSLVGVSLWLYTLSPCLLFMISTFICVLAGILFIIIGFGLRNFDSWARAPAYVAAVLAMCLVPVGTLAGGACLALLIRHASREMFTDQYRIAVITHEYGARKYGWLGASLGVLTGLSIWLIFLLLQQFYGFTVQ